MSRCRYTIGEGELAIPRNLMTRINFSAMRRLARKWPSFSEQTINAGFEELFLNVSGEPSELLAWILQQPNACDDNKLYTVAWTEFKFVVAQKVRLILRQKLDISATEATSYIMNHTVSALCRTGGGAGQAPHVEITAGGLQYLIACVDDIEPTRVFDYDEDPELSADRQRQLVEHVNQQYDLPACPADELALRAAKAFLVQPRATLMRRMRPAVDRLLKLGEIILIMGPYIHAAPAAAEPEEGEEPKERIVCFGTGHIDGVTPHDAQYQTLPWVHFSELGNPQAFRASLQEWAEGGVWDPLQNWGGDHQEIVRRIMAPEASQKEVAASFNELTRE